MSSRVCVTRARKRSRPGAGEASKPGRALAGPLFEGEVYLADFEFTGPGGPWSIPAADLATVMRYLGFAAPVITAYAGQYGPAKVTPGLILPRRSVPLVNGSYSDRELQGWIDELVGAQSLPSTAAVLVLNPPGVVNRDAKESGGYGVLGYHGLASVPYGFVNALGSGFTVGDPADVYAEAVSHEVAELTVDPRADDSNPEVCDGCGTNCQGAAAYRAYFDARGAYLGSSTSFPPPFSYDFFVSAIARPSAAIDCPAPASACDYPPP